MWKHLCLLAVFLSSFCVHFLWDPAVAQAATEVTAQSTVTATVPDNAAPSTPILVAPANSSYLTDATPTFIWEESTDDVGMSHYRLYLDGALLFDNIPLTSTSNASYTLVYDSTNDEYSLTPVAALSQGNHTWKVTAVDNSNKTTDSATWSFTIDTQAPALVITDIGEQTVSISAQDPSTLPASPIELSDNEPLMQGTGEASSTVQMTITIPGEGTEVVSFSIGADGTWEYQFDTLPRDVVINVDFIITDLAGNVSVLNDVEFIIVTPVIVIPPSPAPPIITVPVVPPTETVEEVVEAIVEPLQPIVVAPIQSLIAALPEPVQEIIQETAEAVAPVSAAVVAAALPAVSVVAVASQFGGGISPDLLVKILQSLGLIPAGRPQGLVFDSNNHEPVPFALLTITGVDTKEGAENVTETVVSDVNGVYKGVRLPLGKYQLVATHQEYSFPTKKARPPYLELRDFYRGEAFSVSQERQEQLFLIPMDKKTDAASKSWRTKLRVWLAQLNRRSAVLTPPLWLLSGVLASLFSSVWNWAIFGLYSVMMIHRAIGWFKRPLITGLVADEQGIPISNAIIRLSWPESNELAELARTDKNGIYKLFASKGLYQISVMRQGYVWYEANAPLSFTQVDARTTSQHLAMVMKPAQAIYDELFN